MARGRSGPGSGHLALPRTRRSGQLMGAQSLITAAAQGGRSPCSGGRSWCPRPEPPFPMRGRTPHICKEQNGQWRWASLLRLLSLALRGKPLSCWEAALGRGSHYKGLNPPTRLKGAWRPPTVQPPTPLSCPLSSPKRRPQPRPTARQPPRDGWHLTPDLPTP